MPHLHDKTEFNQASWLRDESDFRVSRKSDDAWEMAGQRNRDHITRSDLTQAKAYLNSGGQAKRINPQVIKQLNHQRNRALFEKEMKRAGRGVENAATLLTTADEDELGKELGIRSTNALSYAARRANRKSLLRQQGKRLSKVTSNLAAAGNTAGYFMSGNSDVEDDINDAAQNITSTAFAHERSGYIDGLLKDKSKEVHRVYKQDRAMAKATRKVQQRKKMTVTAERKMHQAKETAQTGRGLAARTIDAMKAIFRGTGAAAAAGSVPTLTLATPLIILLLILIVLFGANEVNDKYDLSGLSENEQAVAKYLLDYGFDLEHTAAIMGNFACESNNNPRQVQYGFGYDDKPEQDDYPEDLIDNPKAGYGLAQWTYPTRARALVAYAKSKGLHSGTVNAQLGFMLNGYAAEFDENGTAISGVAEFSKSVQSFKAINSLEEATRAFHEWYEMSADDESRIQKRVSEAQRIYNAMKSSNGTDGAFVNLSAASTEAEKNILRACQNTPWQGADRCATWTRVVYSNAGYGDTYGNGNSQLNGAKTSSNRKDLKVGMALSSQKGDCAYGTYTAGCTCAGCTYGHICIYIGNDLVMDNISSGIRTMNVDDWINHYGSHGWVIWGYPAVAAANMGL